MFQTPYFEIVCFESPFCNDFYYTIYFTFSIQIQKGFQQYVVGFIFNKCGLFLLSNYLNTD